MSSHNKLLVGLTVYSLGSMQYVYVLVRPVHAPVGRHGVKAHVVKRLVVLLHTQLRQVPVSEEIKSVKLIKKSIVC